MHQYDPAGAIIGLPSSDMSRLPRGRALQDSLPGVMYQHDSACAIIGLPSSDISRLPCVRRDSLPGVMYHRR